MEDTKTEQINQKIKYYREQSDNSDKEDTKTERINQRKEQEKLREKKRNKKIEMKNEIKRLEKQKLERQKRRLEEKNKLESTNTHQINNGKYIQTQKNKKEDPLSYYKSYAKKPSEFRKLYAISDSENTLSSSSEQSGSSSDDFPSPSTPEKKYNRKTQDNNIIDNNYLFDKIKDLQRRMYEIEIQNRKLKAKNLV